jgi:hypothetical protein
MRSPWATVYAIVCWIPAAAAIAFATSPWSKVAEQMSSKKGFDSLKHVPVSWWLWIAVPLGIAVLTQMGLAAWIGIYCDKRPDLTQTEKITWPIGILFVGSIIAPIFYFKKIRRYVPQPSLTS